MNSDPTLRSSSIGKKLVMGVTGLLLIGFVLVHLSGNFLLYLGFDKYDQYAHTLHSTFLIYYAEVVLLLLFCGHIFYAFQTLLENRRARPEKYRLKKSKQDKFRWTSSSVMFFSGAIVLGFILLHLAEFRFELRLPGPAGEEPAVRTLRILQNPLSASVYFMGSVFLGYHLLHGFQSLFQTLGFRHSRYSPWITRLGTLIAVAAALGFASFPVWAWLKKWEILP